MEIVKLPIEMLAISGAWDPLQDTSSWTKTAFCKAWLWIAGFSYTTSFMAQGLYCISAAQSQERIREYYQESLFLFLTSCLIVCKYVFVRTNQKNLNGVLEMITVQNYQGQEIFTTTTKEKYVRRVTIMYSVGQLILTISTVGVPLITRVLSIKQVIPYVDSEKHFWVQWAYQTLAIVISGILTVACDCMFAGIMLHLAGNLEILAARLSGVVKQIDDLKVADSLREMAEHKLIAAHVEFHDHIYTTADIINSKFQILLSAEILKCVCTFTLSVITLSDQGISLLEKSVPFTFLFIGLLQLFVYCKSADLVTTTIVKTSYSAYNFLSSTG